MYGCLLQRFRLEEQAWEDEAVHDASTEHETHQGWGCDLVLDNRYM